MATAAETATAVAEHERGKLAAGACQRGAAQFPCMPRRKRSRGALRRPRAAFHAPHGLRRLAAEQDAFGPDCPGRDHRRGGGHRHVGDRPGLQDRARKRPSPAWGPTIFWSCRAGPSPAASTSAPAPSNRSPPRDMDEIYRQCPAVSAVAPIVWARAQVIYGNRNWIPRNMTGTTPAYLAVRDWEDLEEGRCLHRRRRAEGRQGVPDRHDAEAGAVPGRISGWQGGPHPERSLPRGRACSGRKGANMMGQDQDDIVLAPWTTMKFRVNGSGAGSTTQVASATATP